MRRIILIISVLMILSGASYAGFHLGLGKAAVKKSADVIEEAVAKSTAAAGGGTGGGSSSGSSGSLTAPANVSIASVYRASFTITWNDQGNLAGVLYQAQASSDSFNAIAASTLTAQTSVAFESLGFDYSYSARVRSVKDNQQSDWTAAVSTTTRLPHCGTGPLFSTAPLDLAAIQFILPIGNPNPPGHTWPTAHNYYFFKSTGIYYPLYAPADGVINAVGSPGGPNVDYKLSFQSCGEVLVFYDHITSFTPVMASLFAPFIACGNPGGAPLCDQNPRLFVTAGQQIGYVGGPPGYVAFDFGAYDSRIQAIFANSSRLGPDIEPHLNYQHAVCPGDYFSDSIKNVLRPLYGAGGTVVRTSEPACGVFAQDVPGTAQGLWVSTAGTYNALGNYGGIALVHDNVFPSSGAFSLSISLNGLPVKAYVFTPTPNNTGFVNRDFNQVTADGNIYCYDTLEEQGFNSGSGPVANAIILLQMPSATKLRLEKQSAVSCGSGPWSFTAYTEFDR